MLKDMWLAFSAGKAYDPPGPTAVSTHLSIEAMLCRLVQVTFILLSLQVCICEM